MIWLDEQIIDSTKLARLDIAHAMAVQYWLCPFVLTTWLDEQIIVSTELARLDIARAMAV